MRGSLPEQQKEKSCQMDGQDFEKFPKDCNVPLGLVPSIMCRSELHRELSVIFKDFSIEKGHGDRLCSFSAFDGDDS